MLLLNKPVHDGSFIWFISNNNLYIGVDHRNGWCYSSNDQIFYLDTEKRCMLLLPVLEIGRNTLFSCINAIKNEPTNIAPIQSFPEVLLIKHALNTSVSDYWPSLALDWLAESKIPIEQLKDEVLSCSKNKQFSQFLRHRAKKMLKT